MADSSANRSVIDTTPATPKPPAGLLEAALRDIPNVMANINQKGNRPIELVASHLAKRLQEEDSGGHLLAAAQWAVHEAVLLGWLESKILSWGGVLSPFPRVRTFSCRPRKSAQKEGRRSNAAEAGRA